MNERPQLPAPTNFHIVTSEHSLTMAQHPRHHANAYYRHIRSFTCVVWNIVWLLCVLSLSTPPPPPPIVCWLHAERCWPLCLILPPDFIRWTDITNLFIWLVAVYVASYDIPTTTCIACIFYECRLRVNESWLYSKYYSLTILENVFEIKRRNLWYYTYDIIYLHTRSYL